ncbi:MAG: aldose 1-epimerase [Planctomycetes bacterium]|nr:aldose 1-epimerase [Planctomycetota bacterium]
MTPLQIRNPRTGALARIYPEAGFNLFQLQIPVGQQTVEVLDAFPEFAESGQNPTRSGIPLLFPFPNRIRGGRFMWAGKEYVLDSLRQDQQGNAIHGHVFDRPWRVIEHVEHAIVGQFQLSIDDPARRHTWPADFQIEVGYHLLDEGLHCDIRVTNPDQVTLPFGFGTHSYFRVPLAPTSQAGDCLIQAPAATEWELVNCLPTGKRIPVAGQKDLREGQELAGLKLDDAFTDLTVTDGRIETIIMDPAAGLEIRQSFDSQFRDLVAFTPPHGRSVCLEPYTCITDAVHLATQGFDTGWRVLAPGGEFRTWFQITAGPIYV